MPSFGRSLPNADEVQQALMLLHMHPYGGDDSPGPTEEQEKACNVILTAALPRLMAVCGSYGLGEDDANDKIYPVVQQFLTQKVGVMPPVAQRAFGWMDRACVHAILSSRRRTARMSRIRERYGEDEEIAWTAGTPATGESGASDHEPHDEPAWLDTPMPAGVSNEIWMQALATLRPSDRVLLDAGYRCIDVVRIASPDPREFDQKAYRLSAKKVAELLGRTANSVSVHWSKVQRALRHTIGMLRAQELQARGHAVPTIRTTLDHLGLSRADSDEVLATLGMSSEQENGGAK